jgi:hypothetical protein
MGVIMKNIIKFILFLLYSSGVFFITDYSIIALAAIINLLLMIALKINLEKACLNLLKISVFILFVSLTNALFSNKLGHIYRNSTIARMQYDIYFF